MSLLHDGAFMAHLEQSKVEAKQQVNSLIDAIYAKLLLDLELWLNKHESKKRNDSSVQQFGVNHDVNENVISPFLLPPCHLQSHSNHFTVKNEIDSGENVTEHNLPGESPNCQLTPPELKSNHLITPHSSSLSIVKEEISFDDEDYIFDNEVEVNSQVIQNEQSANDPAYLQVHNKFCQETMPNITYIRFPEFDGHEISNRLLPNALTHQPREYNQDRMHFGDDLEIDQETLDKVKREIEEEENMKRRENELEAGDMREDDDGDRMESKEAEDNPIQPNLVQPNRRFQCAHCPKSVDHRSRLKQHVRVHTGERPFACGQCDKRFTQKVTLDSHLRKHSGERPFQCRFCELWFTAFSARKNHEQAKHLSVKPYRCKICQLTSSVRSTTISHIRIVHFGLSKSLREQKQLNIIDDRDPRKFVEKV